MSDSAPVIYVPTYYRSNTPTAVPVLYRAFRAATVLAIEWGSLRITEEIPLWAVIASLVLAVLILAVLESRDWLTFKGQHYFSRSLLLLLVAWLGVMGYGLYVTLNSPPRQVLTPIIMAPSSNDAAQVNQLRAQLAAIDPAAKEELTFNSLRQTISQMGTTDKQRFTEALFDFSNVLDGYGRLWQALNKEAGAIHGDVSQNVILTNYQTHLQKLGELMASAKSERDSLQAVRDKWDFYSAEEDYIFEGYNPDTTANAAEEWIGTIPVWAKIENKQDNEITNLLFQYPGFRVTDFISAAAKWQRGASERLNKLKALI